MIFLGPKVDLYFYQSLKGGKMSVDFSRLVTQPLTTEAYADGTLKRIKPLVVCLCGSTRFKDAFIEANARETLSGKIVLSVGLFGHDTPRFDMNGPVKKMLDQLHLRKIDIADEVLILNVDKYIGESTRRELLYAQCRGKVVRFLEDPG